MKRRRQIDEAEAEWLLALAEFDRDELWRDDGFFCASAWVRDRCRLARSTAFEKLRVAHQLASRPALADALRSGAASYAQIREIAKVTDGGDEFDVALLAACEHLNADDIEMAVRRWRLEADQEKPMPIEKRSIRRYRGFGGGMGRLIIDDTDENLDRLLNLADARISADRAAAKRAAPDAGMSAEESAAQTPLDPFAHVNDPEPEPIDDADLAPTPTPAQRRLDAIYDTLEIGAAAQCDYIDVERAAIGVTIAYENLIEGTGTGVTSTGKVISGEAARRLCCDAGIHRIVTKGESEILDVGRKTRQWSTPQRRAIRAKFGHRCFWPSCDRHITTIHHSDWWADGGKTCVSVGLPACHGHHYLIHEGGWTVNYDHSTGQTTVHGPAGQREKAYAKFDPFAWREAG